MIANLFGHSQPPAFYKSVSGASLEHTQGEAQEYVYARKLVLDREVSRGVISEGARNRVSDFSISFTSETACYTNPETGMMQPINISTILHGVAPEDEEARRAIAVFFQIANAKHFQRGIKVVPYSRGNLLGAETLVRNTDTLKQLPSEFNDEVFKTDLPQALLRHQGRQAKQEVTRRFLFAEEILNKGISTLENVDRKNATPRDILELQKQINKLKNFDGYALTKILGRLPAGPVSERELNQIADQLHHELRLEMQERKKSWFSLFGSSALNREEEEYIQGLVAMLFLERGARFRYFDRHDLRINRENLLEAFVIGPAMQYGASGGAYNGEDLANNLLLQDFSPNFKKDVQGALRKLGVVAAKAIPDLPKPYLDAEKESKGDQLKALTAAVQKHRAAVDHTLTFDQLPSPQEPKVGMKEFAKWSLAAAVAMIAAGAWQKVLGIGKKLYQHPGLGLVAGGVGSSALGRLKGQIVPLGYNSNGETVRKLNKKKLVTVVALAALCYYYRDNLGSLVSDSYEWLGDTSLSHFMGRWGLPVLDELAKAAGAAVALDYTQHILWSILPNQIRYTGSEVARRARSKIPESLRAPSQAVVSLGVGWMFRSALSNVAGKVERILRGVMLPESLERLSVGWV